VVVPHQVLVERRQRREPPADPTTGPPLFCEVIRCSNLGVWQRSMLSIDAYSFKFEYTSNSAKNIPFDWSGRAPYRPAATW
jgi:hypothetical protein